MKESPINKQNTLNKSFFYGEFSPEKLKRIGHSLVVLAQIIDFEMFRHTLEAARNMDIFEPTWRQSP